jgi:hypothetical protein
MAHAVTGRRLRDACRPDGCAEGPLDHRLVQVMPSQRAGAGVDIVPGGGEDPVPAELPWRTRVLTLKGLRQGDCPPAVCDQGVVLQADPPELLVREVL